MPEKAQNARKEMEKTHKTIVALGGGEIKSKTTLKIDEYVASLAYKRAGGRRPAGLFLGTASHDSMPYFNSFRKTYTSVFDIKADVALTVYGEMDLPHIEEKFLKADFLYIGGGDTKFMLDSWKETGLIGLVLDAYDRGVPVAGLSAGAICWFDKMYTDFDIIRGKATSTKCLTVWEFCAGRYARITTTGGRIFCARLPQAALKAPSRWKTTPLWCTRTERPSKPFRRAAASFL